MVSFDGWFHPNIEVPTAANIRGIMRKIMNPEHRHMCISGPVGTSKTMSILMAIWYLCLSQPNVRVAIARKEKTTLYSTLIPSLRKMLEIGLRKSPNVPWRIIGGENRPQEVHFYNGSVILFTGYESDKFFGGEFSLIYTNEIRLVDEEPYSDVGARLRGGGYYNRAGREIYLSLSDTNPAARNHWILSREQDGRMQVLPTTLEDNIHYYRDGLWTEEGLDYRETLEISYSGFQYDRYVRGLWVSAEGIVYPMFDDTYHVKEFDFSDVPSDWKWTGAVDYGVQHPCSYGLWATSPDRLRTWLYKGIHRTGLTAYDLGHKIIELNAMYGLPKRLKIVGDSASDHNQTLRNLGLNVVDANKEVGFGVDVMKQFLNELGGREIRFNPKLLSHEPDPELRRRGKPTNIIEEFYDYQHLPIEKQTSGMQKDDLPDKSRGGDDGMDMGRYHVVDINRKRILTPPKSYKSRGPADFTGGPGLLRPEDNWDRETDAGYQKEKVTRGRSERKLPWKRSRP